MTEDETFNRLRRSPFIVAYSAVRQHLGDDIAIRETVAAHHWTRDEFMIALDEYHRRVRSQYD